MSVLPSRFTRGGSRGPELTVAHLDEFGLPWTVCLVVGDGWSLSLPLVLECLIELGTAAYQRKGDKGITLWVMDIQTISDNWIDVVMALAPCCHALTLVATPKLSVCQEKPRVFEAPRIIDTDHRLLPYLWPSLHLGADLDALSLTVRVTSADGIGDLLPGELPLRSLDICAVGISGSEVTEVLDSVFSATAPTQRTSSLLLTGEGFVVSRIPDVWRRCLFDAVLQDDRGLVVVEEEEEKPGLIAEDDILTQ